MSDDAATSYLMAPVALHVCTACGGYIDPRIMHICLGNIEHYKGSKITAPIAAPALPPGASDSVNLSYPPVLTTSEARTQCEVCEGPLDPNTMHVCKGNARHHDPVSNYGLEPLLKPEDSTPVYVAPDGSVHPTCSVASSFVSDFKNMGEQRNEWDPTRSTGGFEAAPAGSEQSKYERMWSFDQYRQVVPGAQIAPEFLRIAAPRKGARVIDFGCGTGEGALMIALLGDRLKVEMLDFARNCLDADVRNALVTQSHALTFTQHDLTKPCPLPLAEYGFNTDVMEHIPPADVDLVLHNILQAAQHVFFQISCDDDSCGKLIDDKLHLSVHPPGWWLAKFADLKCQIHYWRDLGKSCIAYVTAWATPREIVDSGELNIELETIRKNVATNIDAGWQLAVPHEPNDLEVMILGGGPTLNSQLDKIYELFERGVKVVTLNGAYQWAEDHDLCVGAQIVVDARPHNARFTHPRGCHNTWTKYLIGSQCDPAVLEGLPHDRTYLWHTTAESIADILKEKCPDKAFGIAGGCTVLLRAIPLLRMLGYRSFHLFGCDSCVETVSPVTGIGPLAHHAYAQAENDGTPLFPVLVGGRQFMCTAWQIAQAQEFMDLIRILGNEFQLEVYGDGLLSWIMQHGAQLDIEREEAEEDGSSTNIAIPTAE